MKQIIVALVIIMCVKMRQAGPIITENSAMRYLSQFGYLPPQNPTTGNIVTENTMSKAISEFQSFAGLNITGVLDNDTIKIMSLSICGVKDKIASNSKGRSKRYVLEGSKWTTKNLTYKISKYPINLEKNAVDEEIARAFAVWSDYTDLKFTQKKLGPVHIEISFERGEHADGDPFDGPGGTLAHAYSPSDGGDAHFDDSEHWTINSYKGKDLFRSAAHEFGHSLGLSHSKIRSALMAPSYRSYDPDFRLDNDDILGIQALYGPRTSRSDGVPVIVHRKTTLPPTGEEESELCSDPKIDAIFNSAEGFIYVFKGEYPFIFERISETVRFRENHQETFFVENFKSYKKGNRYWRLTSAGIAGGYPRTISNSWRELPGNIDAAFTYRNGKTYFFKGSKYWRYRGKTMDGDYPKEISVGFMGIPDNLDATTVWPGNRKIYFYKGTKFWAFDPWLRPAVEITYPKVIAHWEGILNSVDAALTYSGYTYFFKDRVYYRFNDPTFSADVDERPFPKATASSWFGCK